MKHYINIIITSLVTIILVISIAFSSNAKRYIEWFEINKYLLNDKCDDANKKDVYNYQEFKIPCDIIDKKTKKKSTGKMYMVDISYTCIYDSDKFNTVVTIYASLDGSEISTNRNYIKCMKDE